MSLSTINVKLVPTKNTEMGAMMAAIRGFNLQGSQLRNIEVAPTDLESTEFGLRATIHPPLEALLINAISNNLNGLLSGTGWKLAGPIIERPENVVSILPEN